MIEYAHVGCRCVLILVFVAAAVAKLRSAAAWRDFRSGLVGLRLLPAAAVVPVGVTVVSAELAMAGLVALPTTARFGFLGAGVLLIGFSIVIAAVLRRGIAGSCPCFGGSTMPLGRRHLVRNAILVLVAGAGYLTRAGTGRVEPAGVVVVALAAAVLVAVLARIDDIVEVIAPTVPLR